MNTDMLSPVVAYCTQEVMRQGHDVTQEEGIRRVSWMLEAWCYALVQSQPYRLPTVDDVIQIGKLVEQRKNSLGIRECGVMVGGRVCPDPRKVQSLLVEWGECVQRGVRQDEFLADASHPLAMYRHLLHVHPFEDGNGRTGKVILNWLNRTLLNPVFPPADFWGRPIRNP